MTNDKKTMSYMEATMLLLDAKSVDGPLGEEAWRVMKELHEGGAWRYWDDMLILYKKERPWAYFDEKGFVADEAAVAAAKAHLEEYTTLEIKAMQETFMALMVSCMGIKTIFDNMKGAGK